MMAPSRKLKTTDVYSESFKTVKVFGAPTGEEMANKVVITEQRESLDINGYPRLHTSPDLDEPDTNGVYRFNTKNDAVDPNLRAVIVRGKSEYHSYLMEFEDNDTGVVVCLTRQEGTQFYFNLRIMPLSTLADLIATPDSKNDPELTIELPEDDVIKANYTIIKSSTGETEYKSHKIEIRLGYTEEINNQIRQNLEFEAGEQVTYFANRYFDLVAELKQELGDEHQETHPLKVDPEVKAAIWKLIGTTLISIVGLALGGYYAQIFQGGRWIVPVAAAIRSLYANTMGLLYALNWLPVCCGGRRNTNPSNNLVAVPNTGANSNQGTSLLIDIPDDNQLVL